MACSCYFSLLSSSVYPSIAPPIRLSPLVLNFTADDATASGSDGSNTRILPKPHGSHRCGANATNGCVQCQRAGGHSYDAILRYTHTQKYTNFDHPHKHRGVLSHFSVLAWTIYIISRITEAVCTIIIQGISAFALVTILRCRLQEVDCPNVELMEAESRVPSEA